MPALESFPYPRIRRNENADRQDQPDEQLKPPVFFDDPEDRFIDKVKHYARPSNPLEK